MALSTVHRGALFEKRAQRALKGLSMALERVGGKEDGGIDLQGWWWLPNWNHILHSKEAASSTPPLIRLRVLAQCKAESKKMGPNYVREMEGVLSRHHHNNHTLEPTVALLVSQSPFTKSTLLRVTSSPTPFLLIHLPPSLARSDTPDDDSGDTQRRRATATGTGSEESQIPDTTDAHLGSAIWNTSLSGSDGLLGSAFQLRWERDLKDFENSGRPGLWMGREKVPIYIPSEFDYYVED